MKTLAQDKVIKQFKKIHGNKYDYSLVEYKGDSHKVKIICKEHGVFEQQAACHKRQKQGCPKCGSKRTKEKLSISNTEFIKRVNNVFGVDKFDFSMLNYNGAHVNVSLICVKCNNVETKPPTVWYKGFGCSKCSNKKVGRFNLTTAEFVIKSNIIHSNKYNYSLTNYINNKTDVLIICEKHGMFNQNASDHLQGCGCPTCKMTNLKRTHSCTSISN